MYAEFNEDGVILMYQILIKSKRFWGYIWSDRKGHNRENNDKNLHKIVVKRTEKVSKQCRKMPNRKATGKDGVQGYRIKNLSNLHEWFAVQTKKILMGDDSLSA